MDFFSHAVLPYIGARARKVPLRYALAFAIGGLSPDIDVLFAWIPALYPELYMFAHRGAWHSFAFGGVAVLLTLFLLSRRPLLQLMERLVNVKLPIELTKWTFVVGYLGMTTHLFFDGMTTDGPMALWPLTEQKFALDLFFYISLPITLWSVSVWIILLWRKFPDTSRRMILSGYLAVFLILAGARGITKLQAGAALPEGTLFPDPAVGLWWHLSETPDTFRLSYYDSGTGTVRFSVTYAKESILGPPDEGIGYENARDAVVESTEGRGYLWDVPHYSVIGTWDGAQRTWTLHLTDVLTDARGQATGFGLGSSSATFLVDAAGTVREG